MAAYGKNGSGHTELNTALAAYGKGTPAVSGTAAARNAIVLDAGVNLLYTAAWYQINILPARPCSDSPQPTTVYGCLCMNIDVIREETPLPGLTTGDQVVLHPVGAYNVTQSMQFITYRPAVVMIGLDGRVHVIRERENLDYVQELERVPAIISRRSNNASRKRPDPMISIPEADLLTSRPESLGRRARPRHSEGVCGFVFLGGHAAGLVSSRDQHDGAGFGIGRARRCLRGGNARMDARLRACQHPQWLSVIQPVAGLPHARMVEPLLSFSAGHLRDSACGRGGWGILSLHGHAALGGDSFQSLDAQHARCRRGLRSLFSRVLIYSGLR